MICLCLGSNVGNKKDHLVTALRLLGNAGVRITAVSGLYETEPVGLKAQPDFYNVCATAETSLDPQQLLEKIKAIELEMGRVKADKWGPRIIDIDILFYSNIIISTEKLRIPHPEITQRRFVLEPLSEIAGDFLDPASKKTIKELLKTGDFNETVARIGELK
jgi:2-amino-4-hydroxy-6-hydroxymethyldihydropteridine diphosphokinase